MRICWFKKKFRKYTWICQASSSNGISVRLISMDCIIGFGASRIDKIHQTSLSTWIQVLVYCFDVNLALSNFLINHFKRILEHLLRLFGFNIQMKRCAYLPLKFTINWPFKQKRSVYLQKKIIQTHFIIKYRIF